MPLAVRYGSSVPYGALSFAVIGGYDEDFNYLDTVYAFDIGTSDSWKLLPQKLTRPKHAVLAIPVRSNDFSDCV